MSYKRKGSLLRSKKRRNSQRRFNERNSDRGVPGHNAEQAERLRKLREERG